MPGYYFPEVTLLITHYNRSSSLRHLLQTCKNLDFHFGDIVVSDDGSNEEHLRKLSELQTETPFRLITTPVNKGLGNNINKGQDEVKTEYTLYIQEDFEPAMEFGFHFSNALKFMKDDIGLDLVRFYAYYSYPYLRQLGKGYSEMLFSSTGIDYTKIYCYSDHPHLRRSNFLKKFGRYAEGMKGDRTEYKMCISFIQKKGRGLFFDDFKTLFSQNNSVSEPSTMQRSKWKQSNNPFISFARYFYRQVKYNYDIAFMK